MDDHHMDPEDLDRILMFVLADLSPRHPMDSKYADASRRKMNQRVRQHVRIAQQLLFIWPTKGHRQY